MIHQLIVIGFDEIVANKYLSCIRRAVDDGHLDSYSIVELESERPAIEARLGSVDFQPRSVVYIPTCVSGSPEEQRTIRDALDQLGASRVPSMAYIATEVRAHGPYLARCVEDGIASLVEKPVLAPVVDERFAPADISTQMRDLIESARGSDVNHSVMTLSRYHQIYNDKVIRLLRAKMVEWRSPLTSFHLRAAGGVWNREAEFLSRDDHPYRFGYGMLMHGAYHYIDLAVQFLCLNKELLGSHRFRLELCSFAAFPTDQEQRLSPPAMELLGDQSRPAPSLEQCGETDVTSTFRLVDLDTGATLTLGTLSFEQTTPSIRHWSEFPAGLYNKNGRTSSLDLEAQLSTLYSIHVTCYDVPRGRHPDRIDAVAEVTTRANASLLTGDKYVRQEHFDGLFHSNSNRALMENWLRGTETRSLLADHLLPMRVTEALALSLRIPGQIVEVDDF